MHAARVHMHGNRSGEQRENQMSTPEMELPGGGRANQAASRLEQRADNALFSKHSVGRASGSGYLKRLTPFISPPWKWIRFLSARANEVICFHALSLRYCLSTVGVRLDESPEGPLELFLTIKIDSERIWGLGFLNFCFLCKGINIG